MIGTASVALAPRRQLLGTMFVSPAFDYVVIGGLWSIFVTIVFLARPSLVARLDVVTMAVLVLLVNSAHFAASTVRLYSKESYYTEHPFLTLGLPVVTLAGLTVCILMPDLLGRHLQALYLTWSPFHYAAQTYGLAVMYSARSGVRASDDDKRLLWWSCMLPFIRAFLGSPDAGLGWFVPREVLVSWPLVPQLLQAVTQTALILTFVMPVVLVWRVFRRQGRFLPLMVGVLMFSNGLWWIGLDYLNAFIVATIAHGAQYMGIVIVYHVRERLRDPANRHGWAYHAAGFYAKCLVLGYALFYLWPYFYVWAGAGLVESMLLVTATINVHHFIVDRYIWRLRTPANAQTMMEARPT